MKLPYIRGSSVLRRPRFFKDPALKLLFVLFLASAVTVLSINAISKVDADNLNTFSGTITANTGDTIAGEVDLVNSQNQTVADDSIDSNGNFTISAVPGTYRLEVDGYVNNGNGSFQFGLEQNTDGIDLTQGDVTQNLQVNLATIQVTVTDSNGNPVQGVSVYNSIESDQDEGSASLYPGDPGSLIVESSGINTTDASGVVDLTSVVGANYGAGDSTNDLCAQYSGSNYCLASPLTVNGDTSASIQVPAPTSSAPTITSPAIQQIDARTPANVTITTTGSPTASITESGTLPTGITFTDNGNGTATLSGQASTTNNGLYALTITATNSAGSTTQTMYLSVDDQTSVPTFLSNNSLTETAGTPFSFTVNTTGDPIPNINKQSGSGSLPAGVTLKDNNDGTATLSGNLSSANDYGVYSFTIQAKNNQGTATQPFTLTILAPPTVANIPNQTTSVGTSFSQAVTTTGYPIASLSASGLPAGLSLTDNGNGTGTITGTPTTGSGGVYTVTVSATNSEGTSSNTFTLKVNEGPVITSAASASTTIGTAFSFQVTATGYPSPTYSETGTLPTGITFKAGQGILSGTARTGTSGTYPITITTSNSTGTVSQSFVLTVE
jgi:hypothetical protein